jgi:hypothetical protein
MHKNLGVAAYIVPLSRSNANDALKQESSDLLERLLFYKRPVPQDLTDMLRTNKRGATPTC